MFEIGHHGIEIAIESMKKVWHQVYLIRCINHTFKGQTFDFHLNSILLVEKKIKQYPKSKDVGDECDFVSG